MDRWEGGSATFPPFIVFAVVVLGWVFSPTEAMDENPVRIIFSGIFVLLLPGLLFGQVIGIKTDSLIESISLSFFGSLIVLLVLVILTLVLGGGIVLWCVLLAIWNGFWLAEIFYSHKVNTGGMMDAFSCSPNTPVRISERLFILVVLVLGIALYRWGDRVSNVGWEVGVHFSYIRLYGSGLGLVLDELGIRTDLPIPNIFFLWEFALAGISKLAGQDPLIAAMRTRWILPVLGFCNFYVFLRHLLKNDKLASQVLWGVLIITLSQVVFLNPNPLTTSRIVDDEIREIFLFIGSLHHSDIAMDILLPLITGFVFMYMNSGTKQALGIVAVSLLVGFFVHPREYFQLMWYGFLWVVVLLITIKRTEFSIYFRRGVYLGLTFLLIVGICAVISTYGSDHEFIIEKSRDSTIEIEKKMTFIIDFLEDGWLPPYFENPFNFRMHGEGGNVAVHPSYVYSFLVLVAVFLPVLAIFGSFHERRIVLFFLLLWILSTTFIPAERLLTILTYSEMLVTKVRVLPIFGFAVIVMGWLRLMDVLNRKSNAYGRAIYWHSAGMGILLGLVFMGFWKLEAPNFILVRNVFPILLIFGSLLLAGSFWAAPIKKVFPLLRRVVVAPGSSGEVEELTRNGTASLIALMLFSVVVGHQEIIQSGKKFLFISTDVEYLAREGNELKLPVSTLDYIRENLPFRSRIQVPPNSTYMLSIFAPVQLVPIPRGNIIADIVENYQEANGAHPVFNSETKRGLGNMPALLEHFRSKKIEFLFIGKAFFKGFKALTSKYPEFFEVLHEVPGEALIIRPLLDVSVR